jgi:hypothetical protein
VTWAHYVKICFWMPHRRPDLTRPTTKRIKESREIVGRRPDADDATLFIEIAFEGLISSLRTTARRQAPFFIWPLLDSIGPCGCTE